MNLGFPEMLVILVVALIVFGPKKLPELGRSLGKGISEFKRATQELRNTVEREITQADQPEAAPAPPANHETATEHSETPAH